MTPTPGADFGVFRHVRDQRPRLPRRRPGRRRLRRPPPATAARRAAGHDPEPRHRARHRRHRRLRQRQRLRRPARRQGRIAGGADHAARPGPTASYSLGDLGPGYYKVTERIATALAADRPRRHRAAPTPIQLTSGAPAVARLRQRLPGRRGRLRRRARQLRDPLRLERRQPRHQRHPLARPVGRRRAGRPAGQRRARATTATATTTTTASASTRP